MQLTCYTCMYRCPLLHEISCKMIGILAADEEFVVESQTVFWTLQFILKYSVYNQNCGLAKWDHDKA